MHYLQPKKINLDFSNIERELLHLFKNCETLTLRWCYGITENDVRIFSGCKNIALDFLKIKHLDFLQNYKNISIYGCLHIDPNELQYLKNCHSVNVGATFLRPHFKLLGKCHQLDLSDNVMKKNDLDFIKNCHTLTLANIETKDLDFQKYALDNCHHVLFVEKY